MNLFAFRATDPSELSKAADPIGPKCDTILEGAINRSEMTICAWGAHPMANNGRSHAVWSMIRSMRPMAFCLGTTKAGAPKHPLYIKTGTMPEAYRHD